MNSWLNVNFKKINLMLRSLEEYRLKGSYGGNLNLEEISNVIKSLKMEVQKLDSQVMLQKEMVEGLQKELAEYKKPINDKQHNDLQEAISLKNKMESVTNLFKKPQPSGIREVK